MAVDGNKGADYLNPHFGERVLDITIFFDSNVEIYSVILGLAFGFPNSFTRKHVLLLSWFSIILSIDNLSHS